MSQTSHQKAPSFTMTARELDRFRCCAGHLTELQNRIQVSRITGNTDFSRQPDGPCTRGPVTDQNVADVVAWAAS